MTFDGPQLARTAANHTALSLVSILNRVEPVHTEPPAHIHGRIRHSWSEVADRCKRLTSFRISASHESDLWLPAENTRLKNLQERTPRSGPRSPLT